MKNETMSVEIGVTPPKSLQDIPGLGPIRIRSLIKAGFSNLALLRAADSDALSNVPGMTPVKALAVVNFLSQFKELPDAEPAKAKSTTHDALSSDESNRLQIAVSQVLCKSVRLLLSPQAPDFRPRLLKSLERLSTRLEALAMDASAIPSSDSKKIGIWLQTLSAELPVDRPKEAADRKVQAKLSEMIDGLCDQLQAMEANTAK